MRSWIFRISPKSGADTTRLNPLPEAPAAPKPSLWQKAVAMAKDYGPVGVGLYAALWGVPFASSFLLFQAFDNFGQDPGDWIVYLAGEKAREQAWAFVGLAPDARLSPRMVSAVLAYLVCEVIETPRIAATVFFTPILKRRLYPTVAEAAAAAAAKAAR